MTRGKHSQSVATQKKAEAQQANESARLAGIEQRRLNKVVTEQASEIKSLRDSLSEAKRISTLRGTYTEKEVTVIKADLEREYEERVIAGFTYLFKEGVVPHIDTRLAATAEVFHVSAPELSKVFIEWGDRQPNRIARRATQAVQKDELLAQSYREFRVQQ